MSRQAASAPTRDDFDRQPVTIGARGPGRVRAAFGSVSQELMREADRPVVVVPRRAVRAARAAASS